MYVRILNANTCTSLSLSSAVNLPGVFGIGDTHYLKVLISGNAIIHIVYNCCIAQRAPRVSDCFTVDSLISITTSSSSLTSSVQSSRSFRRIRPLQKRGGRPRGIHSIMCQCTNQTDTQQLTSCCPKLLTTLQYVNRVGI